tara:strand:- start:79 stop:483 length:405 start_codon:yes stop_codon:yes gene_type:complete
MSHYKHLRQKGFWFKVGSILLWSFHLTIYVWLFSYLQNSENHIERFVSTGVAVLIGGAGFAYLTNLYNTSIEQFNELDFWAALFPAVLYLALALLFSVYFYSDAHKSEYATELAAVIAVVYIIGMFALPTCVFR